MKKSLTKENIINIIKNYSPETAADEILSLINHLNEGDLVTDGYFTAKIETKPRLTADIIWLHNNTYDENVDVTNFKLK